MYAQTHASFCSSQREDRCFQRWRRLHINYKPALGKDVQESAGMMHARVQRADGIPAAREPRIF